MRASFPHAWVVMAVSALAAGPRPSSALQAEQDEHLDSLDIREIWTTKGDDLPDGPIGAVTGMAAGPDGSVWISDPIQRRVVTLRATGAADRIIARYGDGPGEVRGPSLIARAGTQMAVYDLPKRTIELFSAASAEFVGRVRLRAAVIWPKGFVVLTSGGFVLSGGVTGSLLAIHHFGEDGSWRASWETTPVTSDLYARLVVAGGAVAMLPDASLIFSRAAPHELIAYTPSADGSFDTQGTVLASSMDLLPTIGDDAIIRTTGEDGRPRQRFRRYARSVGVYLLADDAVLNVVVFPEEGRTLFQLYELGSGRLSDEQEVPRSLTPWGLTTTNELLVSSIDPTTGEWMVSLLQLLDVPDGGQQPRP